MKIGETAYMDGRDFQAQPPLTVMTINLWDAVPRRRVVARLQHGTRVRIIDKRRADGRWYYRVKRGRKRGWVSAPFLSAERQEPIGDRFE